MADETLLESIVSNANSPQKAAGDSGSMEMPPLSEQIKAAQFEASAKAMRRPACMLRPVKLVPPGAT